MPSEGARTVPRMGAFRWSPFGYRRAEVDREIAGRDARILDLHSELDRQRAAIEEIEGESAALSGMVLEREREIRGLSERLREANERHDRNIASLEAVTARLEELQQQARGQATRIRMKALREAVEVSRRMQELTDAHPEVAVDGVADETEAAPAPEPASIGEELEEILPAPAEPDADGLFAGRVRLEIGPLGDFSQLVGFEDTIGKLGASEISVERFSEGRATLSMHLDHPVELLRELERQSALGFRVRHNAPDNLILDLDEDQGPEHRAA